MKNIIILNNTPFFIVRDVWVGKFIDNVNGGKILTDLIELWKEYTETDFVYQNNDRVLFLKNIDEIEFKEILEEEHNV
jgi:UDP-N-acetylglucosamine 2-epimerase